MKEETKRVFSVVLPLLFLSIFISATIISILNDMYAFVKQDKEVVITISEGNTVKDISLFLAKKGIIKNPYIFSVYVKLKNKDNDVANASGEIIFNSNMSYREILFLLVN